LFAKAVVQAQLMLHVIPPNRAARPGCSHQIIVWLRSIVEAKALFLQGVRLGAGLLVNQCRLNQRLGRVQ